MKGNIFLNFRFANVSASFELSHENCALCFKTKTETLKLKYSSINSTENEKSRAIESCYSHHIYITT